MASANLCADRIHLETLEVSARYKKAEVDLIAALRRVEENRVFLHRGYSSLFGYVVNELRLSENVACGLIAVVRAARRVPELEAALRAGTMTFSNARRVVAVLTPENQAEWIPKACELSNRQLQKELTRVAPGKMITEQADYVTPDRVRLQVGISERGMLKLRRVQDLLSQSRRRPVCLEEALEAMASEFIRRNDPVEKAKRNQVRKGLRSFRLKQSKHHARARSGRPSKRKSFMR